MDFKEILLRDVDWIYMAEDRDHWQATVITVFSLWVPSGTGNSLNNLACSLLLKNLHSMELYVKHESSIHIFIVQGRICVACLVVLST
jgi:hypothetical protein